MNLSEPFIKRPIMTFLVMIAIFSFGFLAYHKLPVSDLPNVDFPTLEVKASNPGSNPETMASTVATPLEREFMTIDGLQAITSNNATGSTSFVLQFSLNKSMDSAAQDVQAAINRAEPLLPKNLPYNPTYRKVNPSATPILYFAITSPTMTLAELYDYGNTYIGQRLSMLEGVSQVETYGSPFAVRVQVDPEKIAAIELGIDQVTEAIQQGNTEIPTGTLFGKNREFTIDVQGQLKKASGYNSLVVKNKDGSLVHIHDIGEAQDSLKNDKYTIRYSTNTEQQKAVVLAIRRQPGENTIKVIDAINRRLSIIRKELPPSLKIDRVFDKSEAIKEGIQGIQITLLTAFILVVSIIYLTLGKARNTIIPVIALPMSIFGSFAFMLLFGYSLDILSLLALTLSIGFLVDDAIVVLENSVRHVQMKQSPYDAAIKSSKEISFTVLSTSICLIAVFIPMLFLGGVVGRLFREFGMTILIVIVLSTFIALSLTPMLCSLFLKPHIEGNSPSKVEKLANSITDILRTKYEISLKWALCHKWVILSIGATCVVLSFLLIKILPKDFLPEEDIGFIQGFTQASDGTAPFKMNEYQLEATKIVQAEKGVESIVSLASFLNDNEGLMFIRLKPYKERGSLHKVIQNLQAKLFTIPGLNTFLSPLPLIDLQVGTTGRALYQYALTSIDSERLYDVATKLEKKLKKLPTLTQVSSDLRMSQPQVDIEILRDRASALDVDAEKIELLLSDAYSDGKISTINTTINQYDVIIETLPAFYKNPEMLSKLYVRSRSNKLVPLAQVIKIKQTTGPLTVNHFDGQPAVTISFNLAEGVPLGTALDDLEKITETILPANVIGRLQGTADVFRASFANLGLLFIITIFVIYLILGILYENLVHPLTVMSALAPAAFGGLLTLYVFGETLSLYAFVGIIMLIGIVMKNGILMVDFANQAITQENKSTMDAVLSASITRFRPIVMTSISTLIGSLPIAIGIGGASAQGRISLGLAVVGGLLVSQILTLYLTPVVFYYLETWQKWILSFRK